MKPDFVRPTSEDAAGNVETTGDGSTHLRGSARELAGDIRAEILIGAEWRTGDNGRRHEVRDPSTGDVIGAIALASPRDVDLAVQTARDAFERAVWSGLGGAARSRYLFAIADKIEAVVDRIALLETIDNGMPLGLARSFVQRGAAAFRYYAGWCDKISGNLPNIDEPGAAYHAYVSREPLGVAGLIVPWNSPFCSSCIKIATALAAGCCMVLKPPEDASLSSLELGRLILEAGVPPGVVNIVTGLGGEAGQAIADHPDVDKIAFTGSTAVGKRIIAASAGNLKRVTLELGGKSPVIVCADADIEAAAAGVAMGTFLNSGQICIAGSRVYVHRSILADFVAAIRAFSANVTVGDGFDARSMLGPLISERQRTRVAALVDGALENGATAQVGGAAIDGPGYFYQPTILTDLRADDPILREEVFGPVITILPFDDIDPVVAQANDTQYGLAAAIWTRDLSTAHRLARRIQAGIVWVNCQLVIPSGVPFGGYKQSGWGRENDYSALEAFLHTKSTIVKL